MYNQSRCPCKSQYRVVHTNSFVRGLHASPDAPAVDIYVNNNPIARDITYQEFTKYFPLAGGLYNIKIYPAGKTTNPIIDQNVNIPPRSIFTIAATGMLSDIDLTIIPEPPISRLPNETFLRVAHLSPKTPNVDITLPNGTKLFGDVEYKEVTDYIPIRPGTYELQAKLAGTNNIILDVPNTNLRFGNIYTVYIVGLMNGKPPLQVLIPLDGNTYLQV
ncbi:MAG: hypothetical protein A2Y23_04615 [Clostridiales bacterium GWB2_37_7]|nr:MAG: hypothetical protein A2Y23_04615 [Clostridiales bacterium GWB2_37_7]